VWFGLNLVFRLHPTPCPYTLSYYIFQGDGGSFPGVHHHTGCDISLLFLAAIFAIFGKYDFQVYCTVYNSYCNCIFVDSLKQNQGVVNTVSVSSHCRFNLPIFTFMTYEAVYVLLWNNIGHFCCQKVRTQLPKNGIGGFLKYYAILPGLHKRILLKLCTHYLVTMLVAFVTRKCVHSF